MTVNAFDMGVGTSGVTIGPSSTPISSLRAIDPNTIFSDGCDAFQDFHYSPFTVLQEGDDDDALMSKGQFKALNKKFESLLE